jgi:hypothetical protein
MKRTLPTLLVLFAGILAFGYMRSHSQRGEAHPVAQAPEPAEQATPKPPEAQQAEQMVTVAGPLANYMNRQERPAAEADTPRSSTPHALDHIGPSPVGTSSEIVHKTFSVQWTVGFPFEIPPHAVNARLHGKYQSYARDGEAGDDTANIEFMLMTERQFQDAQSGHAPEVVTSADPSHSQTVDFSLPATLDQPVKYYLIFRNSPEGGAKKSVRADFTVDF